ncbi:MAG: 30S ribosomal protein S9 [bacterium]|nr:30S ribosomal protein S9 [bacterium]
MFFTVGRRKNAIARIRLTEGDGSIIINEKSYKDYFPLYELQKTVEAPLAAINRLGSISVSVKVLGGGFRGQAEAIRHGITRALVEMDSELRKTMRGLGYLTRDPRVKERKKPGLKRARRAPQFSKR